MGGKKPPPKNRQYEKDRRDRLNYQLEELCSLLPGYDPSLSITKAETFNKAITYIKEIQTKEKESYANNGETHSDQSNDNLNDRITYLENTIGKLLNVLEKSNIGIPNGIKGSAESSATPSEECQNSEKQLCVENVGRTIGPTNLSEAIPSCGSTFAYDIGDDTQTCRTTVAGSQNVVNSTETNIVIAAVNTTNSSLQGNASTIIDSGESQTGNFGSTVVTSNVLSALNGLQQQQQPQLQQQETTATVSPVSLEKSYVLTVKTQNPTASPYNVVKLLNMSVGSANGNTLIVPPEMSLVTMTSAAAAPAPQSVVPLLANKIAFNSSTSFILMQNNFGGSTLLPVISGGYTSSNQSVSPQKIILPKRKCCECATKTTFVNKRPIPAIQSFAALAGNNLFNQKSKKRICRKVKRSKGILVKYPKKIVRNCKSKRNLFDKTTSPQNTTKVQTTQTVVSDNNTTSSNCDSDRDQAVVENFSLQTEFQNSATNDSVNYIRQSTSSAEETNASSQTKTVGNDACSADDNFDLMKTRDDDATNAGHSSPGNKDPFFLNENSNSGNYFLDNPFEKNELFNNMLDTNTNMSIYSMISNSDVAERKSEVDNSNADTKSMLATDDESTCSTLLGISGGNDPPNSNNGGSSGGNLDCSGDSKNSGGKENIGEIKRPGRRGRKKKVSNETKTSPVIGEMVGRICDDRVTSSTPRTKRFKNSVNDKCDSYDPFQPYNSKDSVGSDLVRSTNNMELNTNMSDTLNMFGKTCYSDQYADNSEMMNAATAYTSDVYNGAVDTAPASSCIGNLSVSYVNSPCQLTNSTSQRGGIHANKGGNTNVASNGNRGNVEISLNAAHDRAFTQDRDRGSTTSSSSGQLKVPLSSSNITKESTRNFVQQNGKNNKLDGRSMMTGNLPSFDDIRMSLPNTEFSNDLFSSLQLPSGGHHTDSVSPTAAFLLTFPLVSTSKQVDLLSEDTSSSTGMLQLDNIDSPSTDLFGTTGNKLNEDHQNLFGGASSKLFQSTQTQQMTLQCPKSTSGERVDSKVASSNSKQLNQSFEMSLSYSDLYQSYDHHHTKENFSNLDNGANITNDGDNIHNCSSKSDKNKAKNTGVLPNENNNFVSLFDNNVDVNNMNADFVPSFMAGSCASKPVYIRSCEELVSSQKPTATDSSTNIIYNVFGNDASLLQDTSSVYPVAVSNHSQLPVVSGYGNNFQTRYNDIPPVTAVANFYNHNSYQAQSPATINTAANNSSNNWTSLASCTYNQQCMKKPMVSLPSNSSSASSVKSRSKANDEIGVYNNTNQRQKSKICVKQNSGGTDEMSNSQIAQPNTFGFPTTVNTVSADRNNSSLKGKKIGTECDVANNNNTARPPVNWMMTPDVPFLPPDNGSFGNAALPDIYGGFPKESDTSCMPVGATLNNCNVAVGGGGGGGRNSTTHVNLNTAFQNNSDLTAPRNFSNTQNVSSAKTQSYMAMLNGSDTNNYNVSSQSKRVPQLDTSSSAFPPMALTGDLSSMNNVAAQTDDNAFSDSLINSNTCKKFPGVDTTSKGETTNFGNICIIWNPIENDKTTDSNDSDNDLINKTSSNQQQQQQQQQGSFLSITQLVNKEKNPSSCNVAMTDNSSGSVVTAKVASAATSSSISGVSSGSSIATNHHPTTMVSSYMPAPAVASHVVLPSVVPYIMDSNNCNSGAAAIPFATNQILYSTSPCNVNDSGFNNSSFVTIPSTVAATKYNQVVVDCGSKSGYVCNNSDHPNNVGAANSSSKSNNSARTTVTKRASSSNNNKQQNYHGGGSSNASVAQNGSRCIRANNNNAGNGGEKVDNRCTGVMAKVSAEKRTNGSKESGRKCTGNGNGSNNNYQQGVKDGGSRKGENKGIENSNGAKIPSYQKAVTDCNQFHGANIVYSSSGHIVGDATSVANVANTNVIYGISGDSNASNANHILYGNLGNNVNVGSTGVSNINASCYQSQPQNYYTYINKQQDGIQPMAPFYKQTNYSAESLIGLSTNISNNSNNNNNSKINMNLSNNVKGINIQPYHYGTSDANENSNVALYANKSANNVVMNPGVTVSPSSHCNSVKNSNASISGNSNSNNGVGNTNFSYNNFHQPYNNCNNNFAFSAEPNTFNNGGYLGENTFPPVNRKYSREYAGNSVCYNNKGIELSFPHSSAGDCLQAPHSQAAQSQPKSKNKQTSMPGTTFSGNHRYATQPKYVSTSEMNAVCANQFNVHQFNVAPSSVVAVGRNPAVVANQSCRPFTPIGYPKQQQPMFPPTADSSNISPYICLPTSVASSSPSSSSLMPPPIFPGTAPPLMVRDRDSLTVVGNSSSAATTLTNFNLSTIFPEINDKCSRTVQANAQAASHYGMDNTGPTNLL